MFPDSLKVFKPEGNNNQHDLKTYIDHVIKVCTGQKTPFDIFKANLKVEEDKELYQWPVSSNLSSYQSLIAPEDMGVVRGFDARHNDWAAFISVRDINVPKPVFLVITPNPKGPRARHLSIQWRMPDYVDETKGVCTASALAYVLALFENPRILTAQQKKDNAQILTNWGPIVFQHGADYDSPDKHVGFYLGTLTRAQRCELLSIAWNVPPMRPNNDYNCQNWILDVLGIAVARGKSGITADTVRNAMEWALTLNPQSEWDQEA